MNDVFQKGACVYYLLPWWVEAPWDGADHSSPAHHMINESDPILGHSTLETGFLEDDEEQEEPGAERGVEDAPTLDDCFSLPPSSSPSQPSSGDSGEPLSSTYMLFKVGCCRSISICIFRSIFH